MDGDRPNRDDERRLVYVKNGRAVYRASAVGACLRALTAARLGYEPGEKPEYLLLAAREGKRHEEWIVEELIEEGWRIARRQEEVAVRLPAFDIVGHIDGVAAWGGDGLRRWHLLEIKTMSRFQYAAFVRQGFSAFLGYAAQVAVYHRALGGPPILYVVKCRDTGETRKIRMPEPPMPFEQVYDRLLEVEVLARQGELADVVPGCRPCEYSYLC